MQIRLQKFVILSLFIVSPAYASSDSWFSSKPKSDSATAAFPSSFSSWTPSQYTSFQETFASLRDSTFDSWDESRLREWLLEQGIVAPKGPKEQIVLAAKRRWKDWQEAKEKYSASASQAASVYISDASATASQASSVVSSYAAQATTDVLTDRPFDSTKDYVWSTWDDTQLRKFLVENGVIDTRTAAGKKRDELIKSAKTHYETASGNVWETWSDSYIRDWLAAHNLIDTRNSVQMSRDEYTALMKSYYYDSKHHVWDTWSDSELRTWLIDNGYMKSDIVATRDKMLKMIQDNFYNAQSTLTSAWSESQMRAWLIENGYVRSDAQVKKDEMVSLFKEKDNFYNAQSTLTSAWSESQMRAWLIENGYVRSDAQVKKDEMVSLFKEKYHSTSSTLSSYNSPYLAWPDARLRAFLRESGVSENKLPTSRPKFLQEVRIHWVRSASSAERMLVRLKEILDDNVVGPVEDRLARVWEVLKGAGGESKEYAEEKYAESQQVFEDMKGGAYEKVKGEL